MTVIFAAGACGPLVHELGHLFEEEAAGRAGPVPAEGTRLAGDGITLVDDPAACAGRGAYAIDDEGNGARVAFLLREGIVAGRIGAALPGPDGHARRGSYRDLPFPRMACTLLAAGEDDPAGILSGTRDGILVRSLHGGSVDPATRRIVLLVEEAVRVEGGRETSPVAECLLSLRAEELLGNVDAIGCDLQFDFGAGDCLKAGQPLPVRTGMPTIRVRSVPVVAP